MLNKKAQGVVEVILIFAVISGLFVGASKLHNKQRQEKQKTEAGRIEYPVKK